MTKDLLAMVKPLKKVVNEDFYVLTNDEYPTEPRTYRNYYGKLMAKLGIPKLKYHGLRHSFATRCIEAGCDYKTVRTFQYFDHFRLICSSQYGTEKALYCEGL